MDSSDFSDFTRTAGTPGAFRWGPGAVVGMIGGAGEMGRLFSRFFEDCGYRVLVADLGDGPDAREAIEAGDIIVFSVPLHETASIIRGLLPYCRPEQLLMDLSSLKATPIREMLRSPSSVVGLHPMFGGRISSFEGQTLVACPARIDDGSWSRVRGLFTDRGIRVKECSPEQHDRMMSVIQVLFHMTTMLTGRVLRDMGVDIAETMEFTSPSYRLEINLLGRMFAQNAALYSAITQMNPYTGDLIRRLTEGLEQYSKWHREGNLDEFVEDFRRSAAHLGDFCGRAFRESSSILQFVMRPSNGDIEGPEKPDQD